MPNPEPVAERTLFRTVSDWWIKLAGSIVILVFVGAIPLAIWGNLEVWQRVLLAGVSILLVLSTVDKLFFTVQELGPEGLSVHSQLRRAFVAYRDMDEIRPGGMRALFTTKWRKRFALSRRNLVITIRDPIWKEISISPEYPEVFLERLLATIEAERSRRATVSHRKNS